MSDSSKLDERMSVVGDIKETEKEDINDKEISQALIDSRRLGHRDVMRVITQNIDGFFKATKNSRF